MVLLVQSIRTRERTLCPFHKELLSTSFSGLPLGTIKIKYVKPCPQELEAWVRRCV